MTGGSAAHAGFGFQDKVATILAIHVLADCPVEFLGLPAAVTPTEISLETAASVDDILVSTSAGGRCFFNVKSTVRNEKRPNSPLALAINQFVKLWIASRCSVSSEGPDRPLDPELDRLVLVVGPGHSASFCRNFKKILARIAVRGSLGPVEEIASTKAERSLYDTVRGHLSTAAIENCGKEFTDIETAQLLAMVRTALLDPDGMDKSNCLTLLRQGVLESPADTERAWSLVLDVCRNLSDLSTGTNGFGLRKSLREGGVALIGAPHIKADIRRLQQITEEELQGIEHRACLEVPTSDGQEQVEIERDVTRVLTEHAPGESMLVIGEPGSGKSGAIHSAAHQLISDGHPVVVLAADQHPVASWMDLQRNLCLENGLIDVLRDWQGTRSGVLFIDALDATRGGHSESVFRELIRRVINKAPNWNVVASIRIFDLRFGIEYGQLFRGTPVDEEYLNSEFTQIRHLLIPQLTMGELEHVWERSPMMGQAYHEGSEDFRELLRSPFNLFLLAAVLSSGSPDLTQISTQLGLLQLYWAYRVTGGDGKNFTREAVLKSALDEMLEHHRLIASVKSDSGASSKALNQLLSDGVVSAAPGHRNLLRQIAFSHHVLFDYAVARLVLEGGSAPDLAARLAESDEDALFIAPAAIMAFQMVWEEGDRHRSEFWAKAVELGGTEGSGAFCRMFPAHVATELTSELEDFQPVIKILTSRDDRNRDAALFLVRHCFGALAAGSAPIASASAPLGAWPQIADTLAHVAIKDVGWMLTPLIAKWVGSPLDLSADDEKHIGAAAREVLNSSVGDDYDRNVVAVAIRGVTRTLETAPKESLDSLARLLTPDRVTRHGHDDLAWLAREFKFLLRHVPTTSCLIKRLYRAVYSAPLPSDDEQTNITGSRIFGLLTSNRQDFEIIRHRLFESFSPFFKADPVSATETLVDLVECTLEPDLEPDTPVVEFDIAGETARYLPDQSFVRIREDDPLKDPPLRQFESRLVSLAEGEHTADLDRVLSVVKRSNRLAAVWAAVLRAAARQPERLGPRLLDVLAATPVLEGLDTQKAAGDLISVLHPILDESGRKTVEQALLAVDKQSRQILLGCLQDENIVCHKARSQRQGMEWRDELRPNRAPVEFGSYRAFDSDLLLAEDAGRSVSAEDSELSKAISLVEGFAVGDQESANGPPLAPAEWQHVQKLRAELESRKNVPEARRQSGWSALAIAAGAAIRASRTGDELDRFPCLLETIRGALAPDLDPPAVSDPDEEREFAEGPSWGASTPRLEATKALMAFCRVTPNIDHSLAEVVESLARDPSPAVRLHVLERVRMLRESGIQLMQRLVEIGFSEERNEGVLTGFLTSIGPELATRPRWFAERLLALEDRLVRSRLEDSSDKCLEHVVGLIIRLWLVDDRCEARLRVNEWLANPLAHKSQVLEGLRILRKTIIQGDPENPTPDDERARSGAIEFFEAITQRLASDLSSLLEEPDRLEEEQANEARAAFEILDQAVSELYFGSGAYRAATRGPDDAIDDGREKAIRVRFLREMAPTLKALAIVTRPSVMHSLLETLEPFIEDDPKQIFLIVTDTLLQGGTSGGYQFENLGAELVVKIVRRYLADHRGVLDSDPDLRQRLIRALDTFVEVGWPEARHLVYELPKMLR